MPDYDFRAPRLHVEDALGEGAVLAATPEHANYLMNVMRLGAGDTVLLSTAATANGWPAWPPFPRRNSSLR